MKLWGGRFEEGPSEVFERFSGSLHFDRRLILRGYSGLAGVCAGSGERGDFDGCGAGATGCGVRSTWLRMRRSLSSTTGATDEDVHTLVIRKLGEKIGALSGKIHTGRSRNEQVSLDVRLWLRGEIDRALGLLAGLMRALLDCALRDPVGGGSGLYALAARAAGLVGALFAGLLRDVRAGFRAAAAGAGAGERDAAGERRAGGQWVSFRSRGDRARFGVCCDYEQQHGCFGRPRFCAGFFVRGVYHDVAS